MFKAELLSGTRVLHSKSGNQCHLAGFEGWQLCTLSTYKVKQFLLERSHQILNEKEMYKGIAIYLDSLKQQGK